MKNIMLTERYDAVHDISICHLEETEITFDEANEIRIEFTTKFGRPECVKSKIPNDFNRGIKDTFIRQIWTTEV